MASAAVKNTTLPDLEDAERGLKHTAVTRVRQEFGFLDEGTGGVVDGRVGSYHGRSSPF